MTDNPYIKAANAKGAPSAKDSFALSKQKLNNFNLFEKAKELFVALKKDGYIQNYSLVSSQQTENFVFMAPNGHQVRVRLGISKTDMPTIEYEDHAPIQRLHIADKKKVREGKMSQEEYDAKYPAPDIDLKVRRHVLSIKRETSFVDKEYRGGANNGMKIDIESIEDRDLALGDLAWFIINMPKSLKPTKHILKANPRAQIFNL